MNRFFQAMIALSGLAITMLLGLQSIEAQNRATENERLQARYAFMALFSQQASLALQGCKATPLVFLRIAHSNLPGSTDSDRSFKAEFAEQLKTAEDEVSVCSSESESPVQQAPQPGAGGPTPSPVQQAAPDVATISANTSLRAEESSAKAAAGADRPAPSDGAPSAARWYAVLASYKPGADDKYAIEDYANFQKALAAYGGVPGKLEVYRTAISDHYAIVLTPTGGDKGGALKLAALARGQKWAADSFVQDDRNWTLCPNPGTPEGLAACPKTRR